MGQGIREMKIQLDMISALLVYTVSFEMKSDILLLIAIICHRYIF